MPEVSLSGVAVVAAVAFAVPLLLGLAPRLRLPAVVLEIVAGIAIGPSGLGLVTADLAIQVLSLVGLAFVLLLGGMEVDLGRLRGPVLQSAGGGFLVSLGLAALVAFGLRAVGLVDQPLFVAIVLAATALGVVLPLLKDAGESATDFGQLVIAAASIADFGTIILLSLLFSRESTRIETRLALIAGFALAVVAVALALLRLERRPWLSAALLRLQDTTAQIRVRGAFLLLAAFVVLAQTLGLEVILGAFLAGAVLRMVDRDEAMTHPQFRGRLEAVGFGVFIPVFFISSGIQFDLAALFAGPATLALVPIFLVALLVVRGLPALLYRPLLGSRQATAAGLLQATSLGFVVVAARLGVELALISPAVGVALVTAGLLSVLIFPAAALAILRAEDRARVPDGRKRQRGRQKEWTAPPVGRLG